MNRPSAKAVYASADAAIEAVYAARRANRLPEELEAAEAATRLGPERPDTWVLVASVATRMADFERAEAAQLKALEVTSDPLLKDTLLVDRAWALSNQRRYAEAAEIARGAFPLLKNDPISRNILGATLMNLGMGAEALPHLEFAAKALPDRPDILFNLAVILNSLGHLDEAEGVLEKLIKGAPGYLPAYEFLGELRTARPDANQVDRLRAVRARVVGPDAAYIDYALFKQLDDLDRRDEAWRALTRASEAKLGQQRWTAAADEDLAAAFRGVAATLPARAAPTGGSPRSIFIVSLPRTGSTLTERIFSAHPKVRALGELEAFGRLAKQAAGLGLLPYVDRRLGDAGALDWAAVGAAYRAEVGGLAPGAEVVTDKMPLNWWYAPFIAAALPDASIVHIRRQPMDALFGAYKMSFTNAFGWSYRFEDMAAHYGVYRRLTEHWSRLMGDRLIQLDYEALVTDPEPVTRRLLDACGLEFDPACLKPHLSKGSVSTPSAAQVREPVTSAKIGSWRRYAEQLEPLRALLQRDGWVDANGDGVAA